MHAVDLSPDIKLGLPIAMNADYDSIAVQRVARACAILFLLYAIAEAWFAFSVPEYATFHWSLATILGLSALGLWRLTVWSRVLASGILVLSTIDWWAWCTPMPSEDEHSILEPIFGEFLPVWGYFFFIYVGILALLLPVWFFSKHRLAFRPELW